jgi:outer membrane protein OmpA-like peptidoglycan-associated protein
VDIKTAGDSIVEARHSIALARDVGASEHAPQEFDRAEELLAQAQEMLRKGRSRESATLSGRADVEARIAAAMTQEVKAKRRAEEVRETKLETLWETKTDEVATAKARQAIAEWKALEAQREAEKAKAQAAQQVRRAETEVVIAKAELELNQAAKAEASEYAKEPYTEATLSLQGARSYLAAGDFQRAAAAAEESAKHAANALAQAKARAEAEVEKSLQERDRAISTIAKAEMSLEQIRELPTMQYARDMYEKAEKMLRDAELALEAKEFNRAESLADQARVSASGALAVAEAKDRETQEREAMEDIRANALDAVAKAERNVAEAKAAGAADLATDIYNQAQEALDQAEQALQEESFDKTIRLAQESFSYAATALVMAEAKTRQNKEIQEIESKIIEEARKIPEASARSTDRGVVISMGGELFSAGGSQVRKDMRDRLKTLSELLKKYPDHKVVIEGHTDSVGSEESNLKISTERAHNFLRYLADNEGIPLERLSSVGYGESRPIASNINEEGRRQNRRVDIVILTTPVSP